MEKKSYINKNIYDISFSMRRERARKIRNILLFLFLFLFSLNAILTFIVKPVKQSSLSMEPNISRNSFSLATPRALFPDNKIRRGEIVLISCPEKKSATFLQNAADVFFRVLTFRKFSKERPFLSRIVAIPGDTIYMKNFVLYVTPQGEHFSYTEFELNQIPYSIDIRVPPPNWDTLIGVHGDFEKMTLGADEYFVLADNRLSSMDSRMFGAVKKSRIKGKVILTYFPFKEFRFFRSKVRK